MHKTLHKLKDMPIWIPWLNGNPGKKPSLDGKRYAKWSDRSILMSFNDAVLLQYKTLGLDGIGFIIPNGYLVIDLDNCIVDSIINNKSTSIINKYKSYTEKSPSGKGLHIILQSKLTCRKWTENIDNQSVEYLTPGNFVTYTGDVVLDTDIREVDIPEQPKVICVHARAQNKPNVGVGGCKIKCSSSYGKAAIVGECEKIRRATVGNRTMTLLAASFKIGQLISSGSVNEAEAVCNLENAGSYTGLPFDKVRRTVKDGIADGKMKPRNKTIKNK